MLQVAARILRVRPIPKEWVELLHDLHQPRSGAAIGSMALRSIAKECSGVWRV